jgi:N,N-dimethylformamidase beta subunit-like, C-terminal/HYDIN/CFA65/VesB-like, Ig-like domain/Cep192 domain 4
VNKGGSIDLKVSLSSSAQYTMDVYRMGWYPTGTNPDGSSCAPSCGGRLMQHIGPLQGSTQPACTRDTSSSSNNYGLTECNWATSYTLNVPTSWTSGNYIVKLTRLDGTQKQNWMTFVVRDDSSTAPIVYSFDVNTWQAYNFWGGAGNNNVGINLYTRFNDVTLANVSGSRAYTVSFDRPYLVQGEIDGAGSFMTWDYPMIRWMESQGYDMTYITDVDLESNSNILTGHRVFVNTGHDEYYSDNMRSRIENAIASGVNMAFFSANNIYFRSTMSANAAGTPNRRLHCDKGGLTGLATVEYRNLATPRPENAVLGVLQNGVATSRPYLVYNANHWIYAGSGLSTYTGNGTTGVITSGPGQNALPGLIGYEFDERAVNASSLSPYASYEPPGVQQVGHSYVPAADNGVQAWSDATLYTAASGATVFSAGTIQWSFGVDNGFPDGFCSCDHTVANSAAQRVTANILNRLSAPPSGPVVSLSSPALTYASQLVGTTSAAQSVTLTNTGTGPLTISSIAVTGTNAGDYAQGNTCPISPSTLAANASCTISTTFTPTASGTRTASITITDDAAGGAQTISLTGTGTAAAPAVTLNPSSLSFGSQPVGTTTVAQTTTVTNTGTGPLTITAIAVAGTNPGDFAQTNTCPISPSTLAVNASCTISATFTPTATGSRTASVRVTDNAAGSPHSVTLSGSGTAPAVTLTPTSLTFASQLVGTTSAAQTSTVRNSGTAPLTISGIGVAGTNAGDYAQTNDCPISPATLAVNATCTLTVAFSPTASGTRTASVQVSDNAAGSPHTVALTGTGTATAPAVTLSPTSLAFGSQQVGTTTVAQTTTLTNTGTGSLTISSIGVTGTNAGDFTQTNTCPSTLAANAGCTISVTFSPAATGSRTASVTVTDNATGSPHSVTLSGSGTAPVVTLTPTSLTFASQLVGTTSSSQTASLQNAGTAPLTISTVGIAGTNGGDFAQTNDCPVAPATLAVGSSCTYTVTFSPTAAGSRTASVQVSDDASGSPHALALSGIGTAAAPAVTLSPTSLAFGTQQVGATTFAQTTTLTNTGTGALTISSIAVSGTSAGDYAQTNTCPTTLAANASCTISVTFSPTAAGSRSAGITVTDDAAGSPHSVALTGTGTAPAVTLTPTSLTFGSQLTGTTSAAQSSTLQNTGTAPLVISSVLTGGADAADFAQTSTCPVSPATLAVGATCSISVTFTPGATGARAGSVAISDDAPGSPQSLSLSGTGTAGAPAVSLSPSSLDFGSRAVGTTSPAQTSTLTNTGTAALTISNVAVSGANAADFAQSNDCPTGPATLAVGATCTISVTFAPTQSGTRTASVTVTDDAATSPQTIAVAGTGLAPAVTLTPTSLTFGSQLTGTTSAGQSSTLRNSGTAPLTISSVAVSGANAGDFAQTNDCPVAPATLAANATCTVTVTFSPSAAGARTASVSFTDTASDTPQTLGLSGTGAAPAPAVSLSPSSLAFGSQRVGTTTAAQTTTLTNTGTGALTISSIGVTGANAGDYAQTNTCPSTLAANAGCTISVTFSPSAAGSRTASITVTDSATGSPHNVSLTGTGTAPSVTLSPTSLTYATQTVGTTSAAQTSTLTNSGSAPLAISSIGIVGTNAGDFAQTNNCPSGGSTLAAGASCTVSVTFSPTTAGTRSATVSVADDASGSPHTLALSGSGAAPVTVAFDKNLGTKSENLSNANMTLNTSTAAVAGSRVFVFINWNNATRTLTSLTGGGVTWSVDYQAKATNSNTRAAIVSAPAPSGLPANTQLKASFSGAVAHGLIAAASFTGIAATSPLDGTGTTTQGAVASWSCSLTTTGPRDVVLGWSGINANTTSTPTVPSIEIHDFGNTSYVEWASSDYRIETTAGAKTVAGTWASTSLATSNLTICAAYKAGP